MSERDILAEVAEAMVAANAEKLAYQAGADHHLWVWLEIDGPDGADVMAASLVKGVPGRMPREPALAVACTVWMGALGLNLAVSWSQSRGWQKHRWSPAKQVYNPGETLPGGGLLDASPLAPMERAIASVATTVAGVTLGEPGERLDEGAFASEASLTPRV